MRNAALGTATATIVWVTVLVRFAAVGNDSVAITVRRLAFGNAATGRRSYCRAVRLISAHNRAGTAMINTQRKIDFTTVGDKPVAIGEVCCTGNAA